jgi:hypothetical protein
LNSTKASGLVLVGLLLLFAMWTLLSLGTAGKNPISLDRLRTELSRVARLTARKLVSDNPVAVPAVSVPPEFFGMHLMDRENWPTIPVGALGKSTRVAWTYLERSRGQYDWSNLDAWVTLAQQKGVDYFYAFEGFPRWATSDTNSCEPASAPETYFCAALPSDMTLVDEFVTALVTRYKGRIRYYELMNEPYAIGPSGMQVTELATFAKRVVPIIRSIDPAAKIIAPSMDGPFEERTQYAGRYYAAGGPRDVDIISLHSYARQPEDLTSSGIQLGPLLPVISNYGLGDKPIWNTEGGWHGLTGKGAPDDEHQPGFIARYFLLHWSEGLRRFYWYAWDNSLWGTLWRGDSGMSKAGLALQQVQSWMIGATLAGRITPSGTVWSGTFVRPNRTPALVVWDTAGSSVYQAPPQYTRYHDLDGGVHPIHNQPVPIGIRPVLLDAP